MADKNIGGIRATLGLDAQGWTKGLSDSMRSLNYWEKSVGSKLDQFRKKVAGRMAGIGQSMAGFGLGLTAGMGAAVKVFADFDMAAQKVNSIMRLSQREADAFRLQIRDLTRDLGLNVDATQAMEAAYAVASSGFTDAAEQSQVLSAGLRLAVAGQADSRVTMDALTGALRAYGKGAADAADFADILATTVEVGQTEVADLAQTLSRVTTTAANAGVSFDQVGSAIAAMTVKGAPTANVMDALNQAMLQMQAPSVEARKALASVGLQADTLGKTLRDKGLRQALVQVFQATGGRMDLLKPILGDVNAVKAAQMLGAGGGADMASAEEQMAQRAGKAQAQAAEISKSFSEQVGILGNALKDLGISLAEGLMPTLRDMTDMLQRLTGWFTGLPEPVKQAIGQFAGLAAVAALALGVLLQMAPGIVSITGFLATGGLTAALAAAASGFGLIFSSIAPLLPVIAAVAAGVALLATAWYRNWGGMRAKVAEAITSIRSILDAAWKGILAAWQEASSSVSAGLDELLSAFDSVGPDAIAILGYIADGVKLNLRVIGMAIAVAVENIRVSWATVKGIVATAWAAIRPMIEGNIKIIRSLLDAGMALLKGDWKRAWGSLVTALDAYREMVYLAVKGLVLRGLQAIADFTSVFSLAGMALGKAFAQGLRGEIANIDADLKKAMDLARPVSPGNAAGYANAQAGAQQWFTDLLAGRARPKPATKRPEPDRLEPQQGSGDDPAGKSQAQQFSEAERVIREVNARVGGFFEPGNPEQCANFVRDVYRRAGVKLGVTSKPLDRGPVGAGLASSFAGTDVGQIITQMSDLKPGDIVTYRNTYGAFEPGAITHAGIYSGGGQIVHRPTRSGQVVRADIGDPGEFAYGVRPYAMGGPEASEGAFQRIVQWREQVRGLTGEQETLAAKLAEVDSRYAALSREGLAAGASQADLAQVERAHQEERGRLLTEQAEREKTLLAEMQAERLSLMTDETEKQRQELLARYEGMVDHWQKVAATEPALAAQVQEQIALVQASYRAERARLEKEADTKRLQDKQQAWEARHNQELQAHEFRVQMGQETQQQMLQFLEAELQAWQGTDAEKRALMLRYREAYTADLQARREAREEWDVSDLERELAWLTAKTELTVAEEVRKEALLSEIWATEQAKTQETRNAIQSVFGGIQSSFQGFLSSVLTGQQSFGNAFKTLWRGIADAIISEIARIIAKMLALKFMGGIMGLFGGPVGGAVGSQIGSLVTVHGGGLVVPGGIQTLHSGGVAGAPRVRADEVLAKLQTGEIVLSRQNVRDMAGGAGGGASVNLTIETLHNHGPQDVQTMARELGRRTAFYMAGA